MQVNVTNRRHLVNRRREQDMEEDGVTRSSALITPGRHNMVSPDTDDNEDGTLGNCLLGVQVQLRVQFAAPTASAIYCLAALLVRNICAEAATSCFLVQCSCEKGDWPSTSIYM